MRLVIHIITIPISLHTAVCSNTSWMMGGLANEYGHQGTVQLAPINTYSCVSKIHWHLMWPVSAILSVGYMGQLHHPYPGDRSPDSGSKHHRTTVIKSTGVHSCSYTTLACIIDTTIPHSSPSLLFSLSSLCLQPWEQSPLSQWLWAVWAKLLNPDQPASSPSINSALYHKLHVWLLNSHVHGSSPPTNGVSTY